MRATIQSEPTPEQVRAQLAKMLSTRRFRSCHRLRRLFTFLVERALAKDNEIKEYTVALEVFDKPTTFDPRKDSDVRVGARQLRLKIDSYYLCEGASDTVLIRLKPGAYIPAFYLRDRLQPKFKDGPLTPTLIIAEENAEHAKRLIGWAEQIGQQPAWVRSGAELLRYASSEALPVVISGMLADGMTASAVRSHLPPQSAVVALLPENADESIRADVLGSLPDGIVTHPVIPEHLRGQVQFAIAKSRIRSAAQELKE